MATIKSQPVILCACGCGGPVPYSRENKPMTYIRGHHRTQARQKIRQPADPSIRYIPLTMGQRATVDAADYEYLSQYRWIARINPRDGHYYAHRIEYDAGGRKHPIQMHRELLKASDGERVVHIQTDATLDNRRSNLQKSKLSAPKKLAKSKSGLRVNCPHCKKRIPYASFAHVFARTGDNLGRKPKLRPCRFCGQEFGTVAMRAHIPQCPKNENRQAA